MKKQIWKEVLSVRSNSPLVHSITNYVVMNNTANALLAVGASPVMAHAHEEVEEMVKISAALVINIGTLDEYWFGSMQLAIARAEQLNKPWILDPVGAGATSYRNQVLKKLSSGSKPAVIRGNSSEIMALSNINIKTKGVDSTHASEEALNAALSLNRAMGSVVCISGEKDLIVHDNKIVSLSNGSALMASVTGLGCTATALIGAFCAVCPDYFLATTAAMSLLGIAGEIAAEQAAGPGSLQVKLLDTLYSITENQFLQRLNIQEHASV
jgi:hydroxyethylthiazole kinase